MQSDSGGAQQLRLCRVQEHSTEAPHGKTLAVLHDPAGPRKRTAQSLSWHPDGSRKIAVAYCFMEFQARTFCS